MEESSVVLDPSTSSKPIKKSYLQADPKIPGQDFCVLSFISPEDRIKQKTLFTGDRFLNEVINDYIRDSAIHMARDINANLEKKFEAQLLKLGRSKTENHKVIMNEMVEIKKRMQIDEAKFAKECEHQHKMEFEEFVAKYDDYLLKNNDEIEREFTKKNGAMTSVRGVKFSGAFPYQDMAIERAEFLAEQERGVHHFVATSFEWLPFDPNPDAIKDNRYGNKELNELMKRKQESEEYKNKHFEERKREMVTNAQKNTKDLKRQIKKKYADRIQAKQQEKAKEAKEAKETKEAKEDEKGTEPIQKEAEKESEKESEKEAEK